MKVTAGHCHTQQFGERVQDMLEKKKISAIATTAKGTIKVYGLPESQGLFHWEDIAQAEGKHYISSTVQALAQRAVHKS